MKDILTEIIAHKRIEVARERSFTPIDELIAAVADLPSTRSMSGALRASSSGVIAEFKRRSPSKGWINKGADVAKTTLDYAASGAAALSILTDEQYFGGSVNDLIKARHMVDIPILRKEFIVDEHQIYKARLLGADAILLIAAALTVDECRKFVDVATSIGLEVLLELHREQEKEYICPGVAMVGVNNRNLGTFVTDVATSYRFADLLPQDVVRVSESGISSPSTVSDLRRVGYRGFLIGENFMRSCDPGSSLREFIEAVR